MALQEQLCSAMILGPKWLNAKFAINDISLKTKFPGLHFIADSM